MTQTACDQYEHLIPDYCLGVLDAERHELVEKAIQSCPDLQELVTLYEGIAVPMLDSVPFNKPSNDLKQQILKQINTDPIQAGKTQRRVLSLLQVPAMTLSRLAAAVFVVVLLGLSLSNLYWLNRTVDLDNEVAELKEQAAQSAASPTLIPVKILNLPVGVAENSEQVVQFNDGFAINTYGQTINSTVSRQFIAHNNDLQAYAKLVWTPTDNEERWVGYLAAENFRVQGNMRAYQLWLNREDEDPVSVGVFNVDSYGNGIFVFEIKEPIEAYDSITVTDEPQTGSIRPSSVPIIQAKINIWSE